MPSNDDPTAFHREMESWDQIKTMWFSSVMAKSHAAGEDPDPMELSRWYDRENARLDAEEDAQVRASLKESGEWLESLR